MQIDKREVGTKEQTYLGEVGCGLASLSVAAEVSLMEGTLGRRVLLLHAIAEGTLLEVYRHLMEPHIGVVRGRWRVGSILIGTIVLLVLLRLYLRHLHVLLLLLRNVTRHLLLAWWW